MGGARTAREPAHDLGDIVGIDRFLDRDEDRLLDLIVVHSSLGVLAAFVN